MKLKKYLIKFNKTKKQQKTGLVYFSSFEKCLKFILIFQIIGRYL